MNTAGNAMITKYYGNVYALIIPDNLDGYPVTAIGEGAFKDNNSLGAVVIPDGIKSMGKEAFYGCGKLADVKFHLRTQADTPIYQTEYRTCNKHLLLTERKG